MTTRDAYLDKARAHLAEMKADIQKLQAKADAAGADAKIAYHERIRALQAKEQEAERRFAELEGATADKWEELKVGMEKVWNDLGEALKKGIERTG